ncbi:MAG: pyridoxamine 5'-phosphate oxidase family protein [Aminipila sp.]
MNRVVEFLKQAGTFYLATVEGDQPKVRPFGAVTEFEGRLYVCTNNRKPCFAQIKHNPNVEISATIQGGKWIRLSGKLVRDSRQEARQAFLDDNKDLDSLYDANDGIFEVLYLEEGIASFCSFTEETETMEL